MAFGSLRQSRVRLVTPSGGAAVALLFILVLFISNVEVWKPPTFFGRYQDDAVYFSSAQALAQHQQYVLPSFPGRPLRPRFPILYPLLLSGVWKLDPSFPGNLVWATRMTEGFGCVVLLCTFFLLRCIAGLERIPALILTALCAFHPVLLRLSGLTLSDVPFAALFLLTILLAKFALSPGNSYALAAVLGVVVALSASLRTVGYTAMMGLVAYILYRREFRRAFVFLLASGVSIASSFLLTAHYTPLAAASGVVSSSASSQWERLVIFQTQYIRFHWILGIPTLAAFFSVLRENCLQLVTSPGPFLAGAFDRRSWLMTAGMSAIVLSGVVRQMRRPEWRALAFVSIPFALIFLLWPYPVMERYLCFPFLPILLLALVQESKRLLSVVMSNLRAPASWGNRILAAGIGAVLVGYTGFGAWNYFFRDRQQLLEAESAQAKTLQQRREVYSWIREHTPGDAKIVAYDDVLLYMYSGRQALRPIILLPAVAYPKIPGSDSPDLSNDLALMAEVPRDAGAKYWLVTADDFALDAEPAKTLARQNEIVNVLPLVFQSSEGLAKLYDSSCLQETTQEDCRKAQAVLFPTKE